MTLINITPNEPASLMEIGDNTCLVFRQGNLRVHVHLDGEGQLDQVRQAIAQWQGRQMADEISRSMASTYEVRRSEDDGK